MNVYEHAACEHFVCEHSVCEHDVCDHVVCERGVCEHTLGRDGYEAEDGPYTFANMA